MFHIVLSLASRFLYLGNVVRGFAHGILALRNLQTISSLLIPALPAPPPIPLLDAPTTIAELQDEIALPFASAVSTDLIAIESQSPVFASSIASHESSLMLVTPSQLPDLVPIFILLAIISGFLVVLPSIICLFTNIAKTSSVIKYASRFFSKLFRTNPISYLIPDCSTSMLVPAQLFLSLNCVLFSWTGLPAIGPVIASIWVMFIPFNHTQTANANMTFLKEYGIPTAQDNRTSPIIDAIFEQILRDTAERDNLIGSSDLTYEPNEEQVIAGPFVTHPQLPAQLSDRERNLHRLTVTRKTTREEGPALKPRKEKHRCGRQRNHTEREETVAIAKACGAEAETTTTSEFRSDLNAAIDRARNLQERLNNLTKLTSRKRNTTRSIAEESPVAQTKPEGAKDRITRLGAELRRKHDRRLREREHLLHERVGIQDSREVQAHLVASGAQDAQAKPVTLRQVQSRPCARRRSSLDGVHAPRYQPLSTEPVDTGQPPLPPEQILDTGKPIDLPAVAPVSSLPTTKSSRDSSNHDWGGRPSHYIEEDLLLISALFDPESEIAKSSRSALQEVSDLLHQPESEKAQVVKSTKPDDRRLNEELASTTEQLHLVEHDVLTLRRDLDQSREQVQKAATHAMDLETDYRVRLREAEDARQASETKFVQVVDQLRLQTVELKSSRAEVEASDFKRSQITFLSAALQERIYELEAEVKTLKRTHNFSARTVTRTDSQTVFPTDTAPSSNADLQSSDSIYITVPPSLPFLLDLSLPPSSSSSDNLNSLYLSHQRCSPVSPTYFDRLSIFAADSELDIIAHDIDSLFWEPDLSLPPPPSPSQLSDFDVDLSHPDASPVTAADSLRANHESIARPLPPPHLLSEPFSLPPSILSQIFLSERNGVGSVDWPPAGSTLVPEGEKVGQDDGIGVQDGGSSIVLTRKRLLSPIQESEEILPGSSSILSARISLLSPDRSLAQVLNTRPLTSQNHSEAQPFSQSSNAFNEQRVSIPSPPPLLALPACEHRVDYSLVVGHEEPTSSARHECGGLANINTSTSSTFLTVPTRSLFVPPQLGIPHIPQPLFSECPPLSLTDLRPPTPKASFLVSWDRQLSNPRYDGRDTRMSDVLSDLPSHSPPISVKTGDFHLTDHDIHAAHDGVISTSAEVTESSVGSEDERRAVHDHQEPSLPLNLSSHSISGATSSNPRDIGKFVDLSGDFYLCSDSGRVAPERWHADLDDLSFVVPLDCPMSTPVAPRKTVTESKEGSLDLRVAEQLRLTEEEVLILRRDLDKSRETILEMESCSRNLEHQLGKCQMKVREAQDAQRDSRIKFVEVVGLLSLRRIELESLTAEVQTSQFKCSQATFLSTALQERVSQLEIELKSLRNAKKDTTSSSARINKNPFGSQAQPDSHLFQPTDTGSSNLSDFETISPAADLQACGSIYITVSPSLPWLPDISLPPSSSQSTNDSLYLSDQGRSATTPGYHIDPLSSSLPKSQSSDTPLYSPRDGSLHPAIDLDDANYELTNLRPANRSPPLSPSEPFSLPSLVPRTFLSEKGFKDSAGSVDWPPIGSTLRPSCGNVQHDDVIGSQENTHYSTFLAQKSTPSHVRDLEELRLDNASAVTSNMSLTSIYSSLAQALHIQPLIPENQVSLLAHSPIGSSQGFGSVPDHLVSLRPSEAASTRDPQPSRRLHSGCRRSSICFHFDARRAIEPGATSDYQDLGLRSRHCVPDANDLSNHTPPGSPGSPIRVSSDYQTHDTSTRIYPEALMAQPIDVSTIRPNFAPAASTHFAASGSQSSSSVSAMGCRKAPFVAWDQDHPLNPAQPPLTQPSNVPRSPLVHQDAVSPSAKGIAKSRLRPPTPLPRLLPGFLDPFSINSSEIVLCEDSSPCCSPKPHKGWRRPSGPNHYRVHSRPHEIQKLDYSLPDEFVPNSGRVARLRPDPDLDDFAFIIPLDCKTSTPVSARKCPRKAQGQQL